MTAPMPPRWAEALLQMLLKPEDRESVSGDLLEEYRESIVPAKGRKADRWYVRQVVWHLFRSSAPWGVLAGGALVIRYLVDFFVPVVTREEFRPRSAALSWTLIATYLLASTLQAWRTGSIRASVLVAAVASIIGGLVSIAGAGIMLAIWHDEHSLSLWRHSGGLDEIVSVPLILVCGAIFLAVIGATCGKLLALPFKHRQAS